MLVLSPAPTATHEAAPGEQVGGRTRRRPVLDLGMAAAQHLEQLARPPSPGAAGDSQREELTHAKVGGQPSHIF